MDFKQLLQWIADGGKDWEKGIELYNHFGVNVHLKRRFASLGPIDYNRALLKEELKTLAYFLEKAENKRPKRPATSNQPVRTDVHPGGQPTTSPSERMFIRAGNQPVRTDVHPGGQPTTSNQLPTNLTVELATLPEPLRELHFKKGKLFNEASMLHKKLEAAPQHERATLVETIVENMRENDLIWKELQYFNNHEKIKGDHPALQQKTKETELQDVPREVLQKTLTNRRSNLSRYKRLISENPKDDKKNEKRRNKIADWTIEIKSIESILNQHAI